MLERSTSKCLVNTSDTRRLKLLDTIMAKVRVLFHKRLKYARPCCTQVVKSAPMAPRPIPKREASPGMLDDVAVSKYADALPLYRNLGSSSASGEL